MLQPILQDKLDEIRRLCKQYKVSQLYAFGSVCTDRFNENSDIDFLISFHKNQIPIEDFADNYLDLLEKFEILTGKQVDFVSEQTLTNPYLITSISKTKTAIYAG